MRAHSVLGLTRPSDQEQIMPGRYSLGRMSSMKTDRVAGYVRRSSMRNSLPDVRVFEQQRQRPEKIELMYIQSNAHSAKEVRLMAREELEASQRSPGAADLRRTISNRLPRNVPPPVVRSHSVLGLVPTATDSGADWARGSLERSGAARRGSGVHWAGGVGVSVGVDRTEQRAARRSDDAASWARGGAFDGTPDSRSASRRGSMRGTATQRPSHFSWPGNAAEETAKWASVVRRLREKRKAEDRSGQYAVAAETAFGGLAARSSITRATALEHARDPGLRSIPSQWLHAGLASIKIQACKLARLPDALGELCPALERLYITHNQIACLPASCGKLPRLRELGLTANAFLEFPECVQYLSNLEILSLQCNYIRRVPAVIAYCRKLNCLYMAKNPLERLAPAMGLMTALETITLDASETMTLPPKRICEAGQGAVKAFLSVLMHNAQVGFRNKMSQSFLQARAAFQHFDTSGDGALDKDEIREALAWMKMDLTYFDDMMVVLDVNNDGGVDFPEFFATMNSTSAMKFLRDPFEELSAFIAVEELEEPCKEITSGIWNVKPTGLRVPWKAAKWKEGKQKIDAVNAFASAGKKQADKDGAAAKRGRRGSWAAGRRVSNASNASVSRGRDRSPRTVAPGPREACRGGAAEAGAPSQQ